MTWNDAFPEMELLGIGRFSFAQNRNRKSCRSNCLDEAEWSLSKFTCAQCIGRGAVGKEGSASPHFHLLHLARLLFHQATHPPTHQPTNPPPNPLCHPTKPQNATAPDSTSNTSNCPWPFQIKPNPLAIESNHSLALN